MLLFEILKRWVALLSLSSETQKVIEAGGVMLQLAGKYNPHGKTQLVIIHEKGIYQITVVESDGKNAFDEIQSLITQEREEL